MSSANNKNGNDEVSTISISKQALSNKPVKLTFENLEFEVNMQVSKEEQQRTG